MEAFLEKLAAAGADLGLKILLAAAVLFIGFRLIKFLMKHLAKGRAFSRIDEGARSFISSCLTVVLDAAIVLTAAYILGLPVSSFLALFASAGVAIGLAMQGALSNFAGGLMILIFKPFKVGDYIETADSAGVVQEITVIYTILQTYDNKRITLPNGALTNAAVTNHTHEALRRVDLTFCTEYAAEMETVKALLLSVCAAEPRVLADPAPFAGLEKQADSALEFSLRAWCRTEDYWPVRYALAEAGKTALDKAGIAIPYPQLDVHVKAE